MVTRRKRIGWILVCTLIVSLSDAAAAHIALTLTEAIHNLDPGTRAMAIAGASAAGALVGFAVASKTSGQAQGLGNLQNSPSEPNNLNILQGQPE